MSLAQLPLELVSGTIVSHLDPISTKALALALAFPLDSANGKLSNTWCAVFKDRTFCDNTATSPGMDIFLLGRRLNNMYQIRTTTERTQAMRGDDPILMAIRDPMGVACYDTNTLFASLRLRDPGVRPDSLEKLSLQSGDILEVSFERGHKDTFVMEDTRTLVSYSDKNELQVAWSSSRDTNGRLNYIRSPDIVGRNGVVREEEDAALICVLTFMWRGRKIELVFQNRETYGAHIGWKRGEEGRIIGFELVTIDSARFEGNPETFIRKYFPDRIL